MLDYKEIIDISLPITNSTIIYPGNPAVHIEQINGSSMLSTITFGSHTATHIDAPKHVRLSEEGVEEAYDLKEFIGPCKVIDCTLDVDAVTVGTLQKHDVQKGDRVLLKTENSTRGFETFRDDFIYVSPDAAEYLSERVQLVGIDSLSIKQRGSEDNRPHTAFLEKNIPILEGVNLRNVQGGDYYLIALPLRIPNIDGSPARAVLLR